MEAYAADEMEQLRNTVQRLMADNEQKNHQINSLRTALGEQLRSRSQQDDYYTVSRWNEQPAYDLNTQIRRLLLLKVQYPGFTFKQNDLGHLSTQFFPLVKTSCPIV
ncbi:hypothetical protein ANCDUO_00075 [Ancylostoma duodenale]|uniref:Uncharacterized protein n=1 Tax=Ancylostoma duodenale TaxID=51022 RepID=A0A0C2H6S5_9BILA|nr:hypothetical protein ANCDUO_00075 [Ancylostoma duodenale]